MSEKNTEELVKSEETSKLANIEEQFNALKEENKKLKLQLEVISKRYNRLFAVYDALLEKYITVDEVNFN